MSARKARARLVPQVMRGVMCTEGGWRRVDGNSSGTEASVTGQGRSSRWLVASAGVVMIITAGFHALGYRPVVGQLVASSIEAPWQACIRGLWLVYSLHLVVVGCLLLVAGIRPCSVGKPVLLLVGLVPAFDTVVLFRFLGVFVGTIGLGLATVLLYVGAALWPGPVKSDEHGT